MSRSLNSDQEAATAAAVASVATTSNLAYPPGIKSHRVGSLELLEATLEDAKKRTEQDSGSSSIADPETESEGVEVPIPISNAFPHQKRRPLLFIHTAHHSASCWINLMLYIASHGVPCFALTLRGHDVPYADNSSSSSRPLKWLMYSMQQYCDDIDVAVRHLIFERHYPAPILVGHGLGACLVKEYIYHAQNEISFSAMALINPVTNPSLMWMFRVVHELGGLHYLKQAYHQAHLFYNVNIYAKSCLSFSMKPNHVKQENRNPESQVPSTSLCPTPTPSSSSSLSQRTNQATPSIVANHLEPWIVDQMYQHEIRSRPESIYVILELLAICLPIYLVPLLLPLLLLLLFRHTNVSIRSVPLLLRTFVSSCIERRMSPHHCPDMEMNKSFFPNLYVLHSPPYPADFFSMNSIMNMKQKDPNSNMHSCVGSKNGSSSISSKSSKNHQHQSPPHTIIISLPHDASHSPFLDLSWPHLAQRLLQSLAISIQT